MRVRGRTKIVGLPAVVAARYLTCWRSDDRSAGEDNSSYQKPSVYRKDMDRSTPKPPRKPISPLLIGAGVGTIALLAIWYYQQSSINNIEGRLKQLRQETTKLAPATPPESRLNLQKSILDLSAERVNLQNSLYNTIFQSAGIGFLCALAYRYTRRKEREEGGNERERTLDRLDRAVGNLASDKLEIRLGGIYSLERIAQESPAQAWVTIELLAAFIRAKSYAQREQLRTQQRVNQKPISLPRICTDLQAALSIIGRRNPTNDPEDRAIELRETNLRAADLVGAQLARADLWRANLSDAQLWQAKLTGAFLGKANLNNASLWQADLVGSYLWQANLQDTNLEEANLQGANISHASFNGANLRRTNLKGADLRAATGLSREQLEQAIVDEDTQLPDYL